jgi:hypothetical protein
VAHDLLQCEEVQGKCASRYIVRIRQCEKTTLS